MVILLGNALFIPLSAILVLVWMLGLASRSGTPWRDIGYVHPASWTKTLLTAIVFGAALKLVMKSVVMPLFGAEPVNQAFQYLAGNRAALPAILFAVIAGAGFGEETVFRGFMFERLGRLLGQGLAAKMSIVLFTSIWFGLDHYAVQGIDGTVQATIFGLLFGAIAAATGRIVMLMVAHAAFDVTAVAIIYWDLERDVAQLVFW